MSVLLLCILISVFVLVSTLISAYSFATISCTECPLNFLVDLIPYLLHINKCKHFTTSLCRRV